MWVFLSFTLQPIGQGSQKLISLVATKQTFFSHDFVSHAHAGHAHAGWPRPRGYAPTGDHAHDAAHDCELR